MEAPLPLLLLRLLLVFSAAVYSAADDGAAMLAIAKALQPPPSDWSTTSSSNYCKWSGIRCDKSNRVTSISLAHSSLSGNIAKEISSLSQLTSVSLQGNSLTGQIPSLAKLSSLQNVFLDENHFNGVATGAFAGLTNLHPRTHRKTISSHHQH